MALSLATIAKNDRAAALVASIGDGAKLRFYAGIAPANADAALGVAVLLAEAALGSPFAPPPVAGNIAGNLPGVTPLGLVLGTIGFFRIYRADGVTCVLQGSCGLSGADMIIDSLLVAVGLSLNINQLNFNEL